ncbi:P1 family peptidase [Plantibacter sp. YIM 135249]|uniref:P1 family peptidase n=1 Tax=Plantibacter sp. YIM 135249 TaxID=3423918 RepID=UPI003D32F2F2
MTDHRLTTPSAFGARGSNPDFLLEPSFAPGRATLEYDFPGVLVGTAEYAAGPTGATVISVPKGARTAVDARGGATGVSGAYSFNHAICLAGGSVYGLSAAAGVSAALLHRVDNRASFAELQLVSGAIIYDLSVRENSVYPDAALGAAALEAASPDTIRLGRVGGGASASAGKVEYARTEFTGQGAAFRQVGDVKVLVVTIVNPYGVIVDRDGRIVRGNFDRETGTRRHPTEDYALALAEHDFPASTAGNTTITAVVTNVALTDRELDQFAIQVHSSMHRAIQPFHTALDGDTLFALTTDELELPVDQSSRHGGLSVNATAIGAIASEAAWDAVLSAAE